MPGTPKQDALTHKVLCDYVYVLHDLTQNCGAAMRTDEAWAACATDRLPRWLCIYEDLGSRHDLGYQSGTLLGTAKPSVADFACAALWVTVCENLPRLRAIVSRHAPNVLSLSERIANTPTITSMRAHQNVTWGNTWCEGQIELSLRNELDNWNEPH